MRTAAFVDAGYVYAAGSKLLSGTNLPRNSVQLDIDAVLAALREAVAAVSLSSSLLRVYWYDGVLRTGPTTEQEKLADSDGVKLRLGMIAFTGRQKGVDSLIVTDLIELARNHAISDAILLSGDEDVRVGVQIAQSFGVRVHLLGIEPGVNNQSRLLRQESDTTTEWQRPEVEQLLAVQSHDPADEPRGHRATDESPTHQQELDSATSRFVRARSADDRLLLAGLKPRDSIPPDLDRELLACAASELDRYLQSDERTYVRQAVKRLAREQSSE